MPKCINTPKRVKRLKSSLTARKLIRVALERHHNNQSAAARALRLPNQAQLYRILHGLIRDTPAMRAAIARAKERARRAYCFMPPERGDNGHVIDYSELRIIVEQLNRLLTRVDTPPP
jgi:hypothetical protein